MPQTKHYEGKKKHASKGHAEKSHHEKSHHAKPHSEAPAKRRPHHEVEEETPMEAINTEALNEGVPFSPTEEPAFVENTETESEKKVHLEFYGSELIRQKAPKVMELADTVADEWVHDGRFEGLPVGNPLAQIAAAKALRTAKDVEKKLEEKGVIAMAKMGFEFVKSKMEKKNPHS